MKHKHLLYPEEQKQLKTELLSILSLDAQNGVTLYDLDNYKKDQIMDLLPKLRSYFSLSKSPPIANPEKYERPWLTIIKQLTKDEYDMVSADWRIKGVDGEVIRTKKYFFHKKVI